MDTPAVVDPASLTSPLDPVFVRRDLSSYVDPICSGACAFCSYVLSFLILLVAAVVVLALQASGVFGLSNSSSGGTALIVIPSIILALLLAFFVFSLAPVCKRGLPCTLPSPPAPVLPFTRPPRPAQKVNHVVLIVNGSSGAGLGPRIAETIALPAFTAAGITTTVLRTHYAAHARDYGYSMSLDGVDAVCIIGGDGSFLELVNGLLARPDLPSPSADPASAQNALPVAVALIPGGSGNSVSTDLGTLTASEAVRRVIEGVTAEMDVNVLVDGAFLARAAAYQRSPSSAAAGVGAAMGQAHYDRILADVLASNVFAREEYEAALDSTASAAAAAAAGSQTSHAAGDEDENKRLLTSPFGLPPAIGGGYDSYLSHASPDSDTPPPLCLFSLNEASVGLIGDVGATAEACRCLGPARYDICGLWAALKLNTVETRVSTAPGGRGRGPREDVRGQMITAFVNHTQHFGQGMRVAPRARLDDGLLDVTFAADATRGQLLAVFGQLPSGAHLPAPAATVGPFGAGGAAGSAEASADEDEQHDGATAGASGGVSLTSEDGVVKQRQVGCVRITMSRPRGAVNVDGEMFPSQGALYASVLPRKIRVFVREGALPVPGKVAKEGVKLR